MRLLKITVAVWHNTTWRLSFSKSWKIRRYWFSGKRLESKPKPGKKLSGFEVVFMAYSVKIYTEKEQSNG